jgi:hypothetical protein
MERKCYICQTVETDTEEGQIRPYGEDNQLICFSCMTDPEHPEREELASEIYGAMVEEILLQVVAGEAIGITLTPNGPKALRFEDLAGDGE